MLSDEEIEAVEYWKTHMKILHLNTQLASEHYIKVLLDLVEKQSKEIEELKEDNKKKSIVIIEYQDLYEKLMDKIKAKIEEIDLAIFKNQTIYTVNKMQEIKFARLCLAELLEKE